MGDLLIEDDHTSCLLPEKLYAEMLLGRCSKYWPYLKVLQDHDIMLPNMWAPAERQLLNALPPKDWSRHTVWWSSECGGNLSDPIAVRALLIKVARADVNALTPVYDMFNHRSGNWHNTRTEWKRGKFVQMFTTRDIKAGEQLYNHFGGQADGDILRDYGFLEQSPYVVRFDKELSFTVQENGSISFPKHDSTFMAAVGFEARELLDQLLQHSEKTVQTAGEEHFVTRQLALSYRLRLSEVLTSALNIIRRKLEL